MLQRISRSLGQSHLPALSRLVNDLYRDAVSWGSRRDQVSLLRKGGVLKPAAWAREGIPGGGAAGGKLRTEQRGGPLGPGEKKPARGAGCGLTGRAAKDLPGGLGQTSVGTKAGSLWGVLSPKPQGLLSQVWDSSLPGRAKEVRSCWPHAGQPECPTGSCPAASRSWPLRPQPPPLARGPDPAAAREVPHSARSSDRWTLTSATGRRQAGGESQQQRARCRRRPALHPSDCPGPRPRRSFPGRWARVALGTAAPPLGSALSGPHLCGLLVAESRDPRPRNRVFYRRQSPPSRPCIKPFRPARPGTSLRESRGAGPLPRGPPPALCSFERSRDPNTRVHSQACTPTDTAARAHAPAHTHTSQVHTLIHTRTHAHHRHTLTLTQSHAGRIGRLTEVG